MSAAGMRTAVAAAVSCAVLVGALSAPAAASDTTTSPSPAVPQPAVTEPPPADPLASDPDAQVVSVTTTAADGSVAVRSVIVDDPHNTARVIDALEARPEVTSARVSVPIRRLGVMPSTAVGPDPYLSRQWALTVLDRTRSWPLSTGARVTVAVIDDGVDRTHPDLQGALLPGYNVARPTSPVDPGQHGTHVTGIVAARYRNALGGSGFAPGVKVLPVDVFDGDIATDASVSRGLLWVLSQAAYVWKSQDAAKLPRTRYVISMSLGSADPTPLLAKAIAAARTRGMLVIAAAGNDGDADYDGVRDLEAHPSYPANYTGVVGVGASGPTNSIALFSSAGAQVDVTAPGVDIFSTWAVPNVCLRTDPITGRCTLRGVRHTYGYASGTSMATPYVSASAALIWSRFPAWTANDVAGQLQATAVDRGISGRDTTYGYGVIAPYRVLNGSNIAPSDVRVASGATFESGATSPVTVTWGPAANRRLYPIDSWRIQASFDDGASWGPSVRVPYLGNDCVAARCSHTFAAPTGTVTSVRVWAVAARTGVAGAMTQVAAWNGPDAGATLETARPLSLGTTVIDAVGQADTDLFTWESDGTPFTVSTAGGAVGQTVRVYPAGASASADGPVALGTPLDAVPAAPGTYVVEVTGTPAPAAPYTLSIG